MKKIIRYFKVLFRKKRRPKLPHRKEVHTRATFASEKALFWYSKIQHSAQSGNILTCKATMKFLQARKIYIHYCNEFQFNAKIPLSK